MLDDVLRFVGRVVVEIVGQAVLEGIFNLITWRIKGHPYLTCLYRGGLVATLVTIGLTIKHLFIDHNLSIMAASDLILGLKIWTALTLLLMLMTFFVRYVQEERW